MASLLIIWLLQMFCKIKKPNLPMPTMKSLNIVVLLLTLNSLIYAQTTDCSKLCIVATATIVKSDIRKGVSPVDGSAKQMGFKTTKLTNDDAITEFNNWKQNFTETCPDGSVRVKFDDLTQTVSEGIGYGMLLAAYHADKGLIDGLWKYYNAHLDINGLMDWKIEGCTQTRLGSFAATDAELDVAAALVVASKQWPATLSYVADAKVLIGKIKQFETTTSNGLNLLKPGDGFGGASCLNASYFSPAYYRLFAQFDNTSAAFWNKMADDSYTLINLNAHSTTGLVSDWQKADGTPGGASCGVNYAYNGTRYSYDAARTPWRIAVDYLWWGTPAAKTYIDKVSDWVAGPLGGIANVRDGFQQNGTVTGLYQNSTFIGAFAVSAMGSSQSRVDGFTTYFKSLTTANDPNYFNRTLRPIYMLTLTKNFWNPINH